MARTTPAHGNTLSVTPQISLATVLPKEKPVPFMALVNERDSVPERSATTAATRLADIAARRRENDDVHTWFQHTNIVYIQTILVLV